MNHFGVTYAGSLFSVAEMLGGLLALATFDLEGELSGFVPLVKESTIRFRRPALGVVRAAASLSDDEVARVRADALATGKGEFVLEATLTDEHGRGRGDAPSGPTRCAGSADRVAARCETARVSDTGFFISRSFSHYWRADAVSVLGTYVTLFALQALVVLTLDGTASDVGWLNASRWLPYLVFGLVIGALVDGRRRLPLMIGTDPCQAVRC